MADASDVLPCDDSSLKSAAASIPSVVKNPYMDLLDILRTPSKVSDPMLRCHLWELFSAPQCAPAVREMGGRARRSFDIKHMWDLSQEAFQRQTMQDVLLLTTLFLVLSPPCTWVSSLQHSNWNRIKNKTRRMMCLGEALTFIDYISWLALLQTVLVHFFIFKHPHGSLAWERESVTWVALKEW